MLIALTLSMTHLSINHNYDKITQLNVSEELDTATNVESDHHALCNNSGMCVCLCDMNGRLIGGPI